MKLLVAMQHENFFRNLETVVRELDARGHETVMLYGDHPADPKRQDETRRKKPKMVAMGRGIQEAEAEIAGLSTGPRPGPPNWLHGRLKAGRLLINRGLYLREDHPSPDRVVEALDKQLPPRGRRFASSRAGRAVLGSPRALRAWRHLERTVPASRSIAGLLRRHAPDVVLVSPTVWPKNPVEADYVRAARELGIPSVGYLNSWDNLTSKGTVHDLPDVYVVWNEALAQEAEQIHLIPRSLIRVTGAPHLDHFFELQPSVPRAETCRALGCPDDGPYVVYLCSSRTLIADETGIVRALAGAVARHLGDAAPTIVVRPHPVNADPWQAFEHPGVVVYPREGDQADTPASWQEYYDQLAGASAFVGLNTTAFLEAAAADRPCLTVVSHEFFEQQGRTGHFRHLLDADFLEVAGDVDELAARLGKVLEGVDEKAEGRRRFTRSFLRPQGIDIPARSVVADLIEDLAGVARAPRVDMPEPSAEPVLAVEGDA